MRELTLGQHTYVIGRMDTIKAFHVGRRIAPAWTAYNMSMADFAEKYRAATAPLMAEVQAALKQGGAADAVDSPPVDLPDFERDFLSMMKPVADIMAKMSDEETNYVLFACLGVVSRRQEGGMAPLVRNQQLMFQDLKMPDLIRLTVEVLRDHLSDFFSGPTVGG